MTTPAWRKSSRSGSGAAGGQECVEVAELATAVGIRDSKAPEVGHLVLTPQAFAALVQQVKCDELL
ncbi:DUF397 domain-containing protein [Actinomadura chibensis]|uniref:DUF397 domain-containing protein n=1 Tax=Actinomadura chibensis TaxID=392828 RepID=A0A5D0NXY4_9ACTN|nr:DUF397 domain-containing protein [Actinomadura chibensis]TYB48989.1 DUF397 domain-containing protein [Actinomadura chibensis]